MRQYHHDKYRKWTRKRIPEYQVWLREDRSNISPEGEQGFEDVGTTIWLRNFHLGTKIVTLETWARMENIMQYLNNVGARPSNVGVSSSLPPPTLSARFRPSLRFFLYYVFFCIFRLFPLRCTLLFVLNENLVFCFPNSSCHKLMARINLIIIPLCLTFRPISGKKEVPGILGYIFFCYVIYLLHDTCFFFIYFPIISVSEATISYFIMIFLFF